MNFTTKSLIPTFQDQSEDQRGKKGEDASKLAMYSKKHNHCILLSF